MRHSRLLGCSTALLAVGLTACFDWDSYDPRLVDGAGGDSGAGGEGLQGGSGGSGGGVGGGTGGDIGCEGTAFECLDEGSARECVDGSWQALGDCPLGCDAQARSCHVPSNVEAASVGAGSGVIATTDAGSGLTFDTDTGEISAGNTVVRAAGEGVDAESGVAFSVVDQGGGAPGIGVFSMATLTVQAGTVLSGKGSQALALIVAGNAQIDGLVTVAADDAGPGPGGYAGGDAGMVGAGPCGGQPGSGAAVGDYCASGGGGAGYGAPGGAGGPSTCAAPDDYDGGNGGATCGNASLVPLIGGSGGAGGSVAEGGTSSPGFGGAGGGALQITAAGSIVVSATGELHAGARGGGESVSAGGAGGGAGGAILLEAPVVTVAAGAVLATNGGGGGGGDCT